MSDQPLPFTWTPDTYTPADLAAHITLPRVVRLVSGGPGETLAPVGCLGAAADVTKPLLVYSQRRRTKGYARHLVYDEKGGRYVPDDLLIEIPKDYSGFFELVPKDPNKPPVHHASIRAVIDARCERFLVQTVLGGFHTSHGPSDQQTSDDVPEEEVTLLDKRLVYPGEVLQRVRTVTKRWRLQGGDSPAETEYLVCRDLSGHELAVPVAHPGIFCALHDRRTRSAHFVWRADELLAHFRLPVTVRLVFGWPPQLPSGRSFSGVLQVVEKRRPDTLVIYNLLEQAAVVGELPLDMRVLLQPAANQQQLARTGAYRAATQRSDRAAFCYVVSMKTLDLDYRHLMTPSSRGPDSGVSHGMMTSALDMWAFNIRDIFPPVAEKGFNASSMPITFRDPVGDSGEDAVYTDEYCAEGGGRTSTLKRSKSMTGLGRMRRPENLDDDMMTSDLKTNLTDARRSRVEEADNREAQC